ncbi:helix-turn-helix transcriptional regulator [Streptomyces zagrosensis]|uniref:Putative DNA-binding transcriptional regulator YafY n=1 Tax=Streptomyces zagrosensis TaxID=1042984 RepID=A0A7W9QEJ7_9ACTN|nr:WYL domain-containing protein [Streptomyces zagrosensis]MBB5937782.1 putative DNA-binding transcriptional regulator YafY [Streptomyces zagrosensis]
MTDTPARLLRLLSLLQTPREWPGSELALRLRVSPRTVRRDVERLRDLGYPVRASMGAAGGYRLVAGAAMPPLLLDDEEAVAIAIGLRGTAGQAVNGVEEASLRALAKLDQVLPSRLRHRVRALSAATVPLPADQGPGVDAETLSVLASAVAGQERVRFRYRAVWGRAGDRSGAWATAGPAGTGSHDEAGADTEPSGRKSGNRSGDEAEDGKELSAAPGGTESQRLVEPHRLVATGRRWYLVAYDNDREDWRVFRVDRVREPQLTGARAEPRSLPAPDAAAYVAASLRGLAPTYRAVATLHAPLAAVAGSLGDAPGDLTAIDEHRCRLHSSADSLEWLALRLATLGCEFTVHEPPELITFLRGLGDRVGRATRPAAGPGLGETP